jgi:hypothetical protein
MPDVLVTGGGGALDGLAASLMSGLRNGSLNGPKPVPKAPPVPPTPAAVESGSDGS